MDLADFQSPDSKLCFGQIFSMSASLKSNCRPAYPDNVSQ